MTTNKTITSLLYNLWRHVSNRRRRQFGLLLILMLLASFAEVFSIGAVLPFLGVLTAPERVFEYAAAKPVIHLLGISTPAELLLPLTITFCLAALLAGLMRLILLWASTRLSFATGADLSISIYRRTLYQPYAVHCARNSSEVISGISVKTSNAISAISQALNVISSVVMMTIILIALLSVNVVIALTAFGGFGLIYILIIGVTRKKLLIDSQRIARESSSVIKALQEGLGGIRDVLIDGNQDVYCQIYRNADIPLRRAQGNNFFIAASPRYGMEALGMVLISFIAYSLALKTDGISSAIPILGALALGALRLLPVLQQAYGAWTSIQGGQVSLQDTIELLDQPLPDYADYPVAAPLTFKNNINLNQLGFNYDYQNPYVLKQVNLSIAKGSRIGFIGATGSGKSTLLDIIMGLLQPTEGALEVDGEVITTKNRRAWQAHIAHVPQTIFLADTSVEQNIAFGVPKDQIDFNRVVQAAKQAQISNTIENWPKKYETFVGERGVRLSGGQRQRIGIARALYKQADVIIFDEATSALDDETEQAVMQSIDSLSKELTLLIIAHRLTTLKNCTQIVELDGGIIKRAGTYQDIMNQKARSLL